MSTPIFKPMTNMPLTGTLTAAYYQPERERDGKTFGAQVKLRGTWTGTTDKGPQRNAQGDLYLPDFLANDMCKDGILVDAGTDAVGSPLFTVGIAAIVIERTEQGQKRKTTIRPQDGAVAAPKPAPAKPNGPPMPVPTTVKRIDAGPGMPVTAKPFPAPPNPFAEPATGDALWAELEARYARCWAIVARVVIGQDGEGTDIDLAACAATLFIEANRRNLPGVPAVTPKVGEGFEAMPEALGEAHDDETDPDW